MISYDALLVQVKNLIQRNPKATQKELSIMLGKSPGWLAVMKKNDSRLSAILPDTRGRREGEAAPNRQDLTSAEYIQIKKLIRENPKITQIEISAELGKPSWWVTAIKKRDSRLAAILNKIN